MFYIKRKYLIALGLLFLFSITAFIQFQVKGSDEAKVETKKKKDAAVYVSNTNDEVQIAKTTKFISMDFFSKAKMDREMSRDRCKSDIKDIMQNGDPNSEIISKVEGKLNEITKITEEEMKIETLIRERGFSDSLALIGSDGSVDIVVKAPSLANWQVSQLADIASRQANVELELIHIKASGDGN